MRKRKRLAVAVLCALSVAGIGGALSASPAGAAVQSTSGDAVFLPIPPPSVRFGKLQSDTNMFVFNEQQNFVLTDPLPVDITVPGTYDQLADLTPGTLPAGLKVHSHFAHCDNVGAGGGPHHLTATVVTDSEIVGISLRGANLDNSDVLGATGTEYPTGDVRRQFSLTADGDEDLVVEQIDRQTVLIHCEVVAHADQVRIITRAERRTPEVKSEVHNAAHEDITGDTVEPGTLVHDKAIVTGSGPLVPTGNVTFLRFTNGTCTAPAAASEVVALGPDGTAESSTFTTVAGSMAYKVLYEGNAIYAPAEGPCEPLHVEPDVKVKTEVHEKYSHKDITGQAVFYGTYVHDKAIVTGSGPVPTGTVTFKLFNNGTCYGSAVSYETKYLNSYGTAESSNIKPGQGSWSYLVRYNGNSTYDPATGPCEPFKVEKKGCEGCSAYFWKTHTYKWKGYSPSDSFETIFGRDVFAGDPTLLQVLGMSGSDLANASKEAVAGLLNAAHPDVEYALTSTYVIEGWKWAVDHGDDALEVYAYVLWKLNKNCPWY